MTYREKLMETRQRLKEAGVEEWKTDAWLLFSAASGLSRSRYLLDEDKPFPKEKEETLGQMATRRAKREPVQYLLGEQDFYGRPFRVEPGVLIPRQDTEVLVEEALKGLAPGSRVLDLCTGSGCILVSILCEGKGLAGTGTDISPKALALAKENAERNGTHADFVQGDLFENVEGTYDLIVSNPPYIPTGDIEGLMPEVRDFEPHLALDGSGDGLSFYRRIAAEGQDYLSDGGKLYLEIGNTQAREVCGLLEAEGWEHINVRKDLAGNDRVVCARKRE